MPMILAILTLAGSVAPLLVIISVLTGNVAPNVVMTLQYGVAANLYELLFVVVLSLPVSIASLIALRRKRVSVYYYIIGWVLVCMSPLCLSGVRIDMDTYLIELLYYAVLGVVIAFYLLKSKAVKNYFSRTSKRNK